MLWVKRLISPTIEQLEIEQAKLELALLEEEVRLTALSSFPAFIRAVDPTYKFAWFHNVLAEVLDDVYNRKRKRVIINIPPQHGKLLADDTPVLTTEGWKTHGSLNVGDHVYSPSGKPTRVVWVSEPGLADRVVKFTNGAEIKCHAAHEWTIFDKWSHTNKTVETQWMEAKGPWYGPANTRGSRAKFMLPIQEPIQNPNKSLPMHPYALGAWLGDGTSTKPWITHAATDAAVVAKIEACGYVKTKVYVHKTTGVHSSVFAGPHSGVNGPFGKGLRDAGVFDNKHIPDTYKTASLTQRLDLLAGLIDTDGSVDKTGRVYFTNTNKRLIDDVADVVRTFGWRATTFATEPCLSSSGIQGTKTCYALGFNPTIPLPTQLPRKTTTKLVIQRRIGVESITKCEPVTGRCIQVEAADGLYLAGREMIPTHNSQQASRLFPAYYLARNPDFKMIAASYSAELASSNNRDVQRIMESEAYKEVAPHVRLPGENVRTQTGKRMRNSDIFELEGFSGRYRSAGVGGALTGFGAGGGLIDDPIKDFADASSPVIRQKQIDWYTSTFKTRIAPDGWIILIMTRWHENDLAGYLINQMTNDPKADQWDIITLPAVKETDDPSKPYDIRQVGEALWPESGRDLAWCKATEASAGPTTWAGLYQQRPSVQGGGTIKTFNFRFWYNEGTEPMPYLIPNSNSELVPVPQVPLPKDFRRYTSSWDMAFKETKTSDFVVGTMWGHDRPEAKAEAYLLDMYRARADITKTLAAVEDMAKNWPKCRQHLIEAKANGDAVIGLLKQKIAGLTPVTPDGGKVSRAEAAAINIDAGNVILPHPSVHPWVLDLLAECNAFPRGAHDDAVDSMTQALNHMFGVRPFKIFT